MTLVLSAIVWHMLIASGLAVLVALAGLMPWLRRRPAVMHTLWLLVLAKFITPAFVPLPLLPTQPTAMVSSPAEISPAPIPVTEGVQAPAQQIQSPNTTPDLAAVASPATVFKKVTNSDESRNVSAANWPWSMWLLGASIVGSGLIALRTGILMVQFNQWLRLSSVANARLSHLLAICRERMGLRDVPEIRMLQARYSPFLWAGGRTSCIYIPQTMVDGFTDEQLSGILCHELAHHSRRDTWANLFAFGVAMVCWWNPLVWMARRALSEMQELCCDALVVALPELSRRDYAETLYLTLELIDRKSTLPGVLASGWDDASSLKSRFRMIGDAAVVPHTSRVFMVGALLLAASLVCLPIRAQESARPRPQSNTEQKPVQQIKEANAVPQPSKQSVRAATLKDNIAQFTLRLDYIGESDKPYQSLLLSVPPIESKESDPNLDGEQLEEEEARRIIDHLAAEGFLGTAHPVSKGLDSLNGITPRGYRMTVSNQFYGDLGWNLGMLMRLQALRGVLVGHSRAGLDRLLNRLDGHRQEWEQEATQTTAAVRVNGADFQAVALQQWSAPQMGQPTSIQLGLKITNQTQKKMQINLFETVRVRLRDAEGRELKVQWGRDRLSVRAPVVIPSGEIRTISRVAKLERLVDYSGLRLSGPDETGGVWWCDPLQPGKYTVSFEYENNADKIKTVEGYLSKLTPPANQLIDPLEAPYWIGKVATVWHAVEIVDPDQLKQSEQRQQRAGNLASITQIHPTKVNSEQWLKLKERLTTSGMQYRMVSIDEKGFCHLNLGVSATSDLTPLKGMSINSLDVSHTAVADLSPLEGMPLRVIDISGSQVTSLTPLKGMPLTALRIWGTKVSDLSPVTGAKLTEFVANSTSVSDLTPLSSMPLTYVDIRRTAVKDLTPLATTPLKSLQIEECEVTDLTPLQKTPLDLLRLTWTAGLDLSQLQGIPLKSLNLTGEQIVDLSPLRGTKLESLGLIKTGVKDLTPLKDIPLTGIHIEGSPVADLTPLKGLKLVNAYLFVEEADLISLSGMPLETIGLPQLSKVKNIEILRNMKTLKWIRLPECKPLLTAEFWRAYDGGGFAK